jgi:hypothetical protein
MTLQICSEPGCIEFAEFYCCWTTANLDLLGDTGYCRDHAVRRGCPIAPAEYLRREQMEGKR